MPNHDLFRKHGSGVADGSSLTVGPSDVGSPALEVHTIVFGGACDVKVIVDIDGTEEVNETVYSFDSSDAPGISMANEIELIDGMKLRVTNTSGGAADFVVSGETL